jgi:hypothetical protein
MRFMSTIRFFLLVLASGFLFGVLSLTLFFKEARWPLLASFPSASLVASTSNTYLGPQKPVVGNPQLVRVQVIVRDAPEASGLQIISAEFNGQPVPLQPRDIYGNRGQASFQVPPNKYKLKWKMNRDKFAWPRTITHEEEVTVSPRDLWLQITIEGESASIR